MNHCCCPYFRLAFVVYFAIVVAVFGVLWLRFFEMWLLWLLAGEF